MGGRTAISRHQANATRQSQPVINGLLQLDVQDQQPAIERNRPMTQSSISNTQSPISNDDPIEFTISQLSRLLDIREPTLRRHLHKVDPKIKLQAPKRQQQLVQVIQWETVIALHAQATPGGRLARKLAWLIDYFGDDP
jgi:hypothetical protein